MFDTEDALIRIDMSEYMEKFSVSRLVGAPPGYVGYEEGGQLTEKVRRKPYSIILLDEVEKAHPDIFNVMLQVFDDGQLTDGLGRKIDFKNSIIIMTSNIGVRQLKDFGTGVGFGTSAKESRKEEDQKMVIEKSLKKSFSPEFLNRVDEMIVFNSLGKAEIHSIIDIALGSLLKRIHALKLEMEITESAKDFLSDKGYDPEYGARPLHRAIQKWLEDPLAEELLALNAKEGDVLLVTKSDKEDKLTITLKGKDKDAKKSKKETN
jgi:ATP-dependent Clp protease ATP-binding subunit ClpC